MELEWALHVRSYPGAPRGGDLGLVLPFKGGALAALVDASGHGLTAYAAAQAARRALLEAGAREPDVLLRALDAALAGTVGAAASVACVEGRTLAFAGVGNVAATVGLRPLVVRGGVLGQRPRIPAVVRVPFEPGTWLMMHTDGVSPPPAVPAGSAESAARALVEAHGSTHDDAAVLLLRWRESRAVTRLGLLRITTPDALPFAREKLRACLVVAGLPRVFAGQVTTLVSQALRDRLPTELAVHLEEDGNHLLLRPPEVAGRHQRLRLPRAPDPGDVELMQAILARLTREELLYDLEHQVQQRTADLERERERSERLLRNMLPDVIAKRMKDGETIADVHEASVLFADIKGFTALASERNAEDVVRILDRIFREFDDLAHRHGLEKIKTIGDAYMAAAGLPVPQADHVDRAVQMGLDMVASIVPLRQELGVSLDVRVGIHSGPVVAGVIGTKKHAYDVWGDTVNVASRMESHGVPGRVQVSDDVRRTLGRRYRVEDRGTIEIKNRGTMRTWFVHGIAVLEP